MAALLIPFFFFKFIATASSSQELKFKNYNEKRGKNPKKQTCNHKSKYH